MRGSSFKYLLKEGLRNFYHNRLMAFTSIGVLTICLLIVGMAYMVTVNVNSMIGVVENQSEMSVIMEDVGDDVIKKAEEKISSMTNVRDVEYISKEQGLQNTIDMLGEDGYLLEGLEDRNTIPATFVVKIHNLEMTKQTQSELQAIEGVEQVLASGEMADTLVYVRRTITTIGTAMIIALAVISLVIISNTIKATIFTRRKEISIMKYVGATNTFIRIPFVVEGFTLGLVSAVIAFLFTWGGYAYLTNSLSTNATLWLSTIFESIIPFSELALNLGIFFLATGTVLGIFGSVISINKHARV